MPRSHLVPIFFVLLWLAHGGCGPGVELPKTQTFDADGVKIAYFVEGEGKPVILIHGWLSAAGINWVLPGTSGALSKEFQVIGFDVRGHGLSDKPTEEDAYGKELVEDVVRLMDHLNIKKAHIVGYSMGGIIAANFIVKHPDRVLSGTLGGMGWLQEGGVGQWLFSQIGKKDKDAKAHAVCGRSFAKLALTEEQIKSIKVPMTVLIGSDDRLVKKLYIEPLAKARPDWHIIEIKGGGHLTTIVKEQFRDEIANWLKQQAVTKKSQPDEAASASPK